MRLCHPCLTHALISYLCYILLSQARQKLLEAHLEPCVGITIGKLLSCPSFRGSSSWIAWTFLDPYQNVLPPAQTCMKYLITPSP